MGKNIYGEGTFSEAKNRPKTPLRYRKRILGKYVSVYGKSERECIKKMKQKEMSLLEKEKLMHPTDVNECALLKDAIEYWLETYKKPVVKGRSYERLEQISRVHIAEDTLGRTSIDNVGADDIQILLNRVALNKSQSTVNKVYSLLNQFFEYYYKRDINNNPMLSVLKPQKQKDYSVEDAGVIDNNKVLSDEEIELLSKELTKPYKNGSGGYKCGYVLLFIMWSYLRYGEAVAIQYKDVSKDEKTGRMKLRIAKEFSHEKNYDSNKLEWKLTTPKTKHSVRTIPLNNQALEAFNKYVELYCEDISNDDFVFQSEQGNPISNQHLNKKLKQALKNAGIHKDISVHGLRHTGISYWIRHGIDIAAISRTAGHTDLTTTIRIYYNVIEEQKMFMFDNVK